MKTKFSNIDEILDLLPALPGQLTGIQETLIANLIMLSEIPAPTFEEAARVKLLLQRIGRQRFGLLGAGALLFLSVTSSIAIIAPSPRTSPTISKLSLKSSRRLLITVPNF